MQLVKIELHDEEDPISGQAPFDWALVESRRHGRLESRRVTHTKGSHRQSLSHDELFKKFATCLEYAKWPHEPALAFDRLMAIETQPSAAPLIDPAPRIVVSAALSR
jgi:hypothetical protein